MLQECQQESGDVTGSCMAILMINCGNRQRCPRSWQSVAIVFNVGMPCPEIGSKRVHNCLLPV